MHDMSLDLRGMRFTAAITSGVLALGLVTTSWRILAAQTVLFALCAVTNMKLNPWGQLFRQAVRPRLAGAGAKEAESPGSVRFAQGVGFIFALTATLGYAAGWTTLGIVANTFALVAALLNAAFGVCLGCRFYLVLHRFRPAASTSS